MIFAGSFRAVVALGAALEVSKLVAVAWLYRFRHLASKPVRMYFYTATILLMVITSLGIFGYLSHVDMETTSITAKMTLDEIAQREAGLTAELNRLNREVDSISAQSNKLVDQLGASYRLTRENGAVQVQRETSAKKTQLFADIKRVGEELRAVKTEQIAKKAEFGKATADIGPLRYVAQAIYGNDSVETIQKAIVWLIILLMSVFDPMAIMMLIAANILFKQIEAQKSTQNGPTSLGALRDSAQLETGPTPLESVMSGVQETPVAANSVPELSDLNTELKAAPLFLKPSKKMPKIKQTPNGILKAAAKAGNPERASEIPASLLSNAYLEKESKKVVDKPR